MTLLIKKERQRRKWTLTYVAERTSTTKSMVQMLETGQRKPSYEVLLKLEDLFEMNHRDLFKEIDIKWKEKA